MKILELEPVASPFEQGRAHGAAFADMIHELAAIRLERTHTLGSFASKEQVLEYAARHLPVLESYDAELYAEFRGMAEGAAIDEARLVVLNHYTDLRDIDPAAVDPGAPSSAPDPGSEDDCSAVFARTEAGSLLGQTWDMHGSALPYVLMIHVPERGHAPASWTLSITGCFGMTGLNAAGVGITINNLKSLDARIGVLWPALVRRALRERSVAAAREVIAQAPLGSGHHYMVASREGAYGIETSGTRRKTVYVGGGRDFVHTNHCLDVEMAALHTVGLDSTTHDRYDRLTGSVAADPIRGRADLWERFGSHTGYPRSICTHVAAPHRPHAMRTCGALVMDLEAVDLWAADGCIHRARPHVLSFHK